MLYEIMEWFMGKMGGGFCKEVFYTTFLDSVSKQGGCSSREDAYPWVDVHLWEDAHPRKMFNYGGCLSMENAQLGKMFVHGGCSLMTVQLRRMLTHEEMLI